MLMQIFATLFIGGFITLAVIGHVALFHALFFRREEPVSQPAERKLRLVVLPPREFESAREQFTQVAKPALRIA